MGLVRYYDIAIGYVIVPIFRYIWKHGLTSKNTQSQLTYFCKSNINQTFTNGGIMIWGVRIAIFTEIRHLVEELTTFLSIFGLQKWDMLTARLKVSQYQLQFNERGLVCWSHKVTTFFKSPRRQVITGEACPKPSHWTRKLCTNQGSFNLGGICCGGHLVVTYGAELLYLRIFFVSKLGFQPVACQFWQLRTTCVWTVFHPTRNPTHLPW